MKFLIFDCKNHNMILKHVKESRQPWAIFQFPFFFWQVDNKESKTKYNSIAV